MYDTIAIKYFEEKIKETISKLENPRLIVNPNNGDIQFATGKIRNLRCKVFNSSIRIEGSLSKFYFGNNLETLDIFTTEKAVLELCRVLNLDLRKGEVTKIHFAENISVDYPTNRYFEKLGSISRYQKSSYSTGVLFSNNNKALLFYDKAEEMKKNQPMVLKNKELVSNILRYELKLNRRIKKILKKSQILFEDLYNAKFYKELLDLWVDEYSKISKLPEIRKSFQYISRDVVKTKNNLCLIGILSIGGSEVVQKEVRKYFNGGHCNRSQYNRLMKKIIELNSLSLKEMPSNLIIELDEKIKAVGSRFQLDRPN